jgi:Spy/CpxP family protein refolding chaperone
MSTSRARAALIIAAIAIGSAMAGAGIDRWLMSRGPRHGGGRGGGPMSAGASPAAAAKRRGEMLDRMSRDLNLTPAQRVGIDSIMQRTDSALRAVRAEAQPRLTRIFESSRAEISARLDSAQRVKFAQRQSRRRERR